MLGIPTCPKKIQIGPILNFDLLSLKLIKMDCKQSREILDFPQAPDRIEMCEKKFLD